MQILTQEVQPGDVIRRKQLWKFDVPTNYQVKLLLDYFDDYSDSKLGLGSMIVVGSRPAEVCNFVWPRFVIDDDGQISRVYHDAYKAKSYKGKRGKRVEYKELEKYVSKVPLTLPNGKRKWVKHSPWLSDQYIKYRKRGLNYGNHCFAWTDAGSFRKCFERFRKSLRIKLAKGELDEEYKAWLDTDTDIIYGVNDNEYRLVLYSLRKFCITFFYWVIFKGDLIATSKYFGHSDPSTTAKHYIRPKEAIGLTQEMIDAQISIDEFIFMSGKPQQPLLEFDPEWKLQFLPAGQRSLNEFNR